MLSVHMLKKKLRERRAERLVEYISLLKNEEKQLLEKFKSITSQQMLKYPENRTIDFNKYILQKSSFQIVLQRNNILHDMNILKFTIPSLSISLTGCNDIHPLGNIMVHSTGTIAIQKENETASCRRDSTTWNNVEVCSTRRTKTKEIKEDGNEGNHSFNIFHLIVAGTKTPRQTGTHRHTRTGTHTHTRARAPTDTREPTHTPTHIDRHRQTH